MTQLIARPRPAYATTIGTSFCACFHNETRHEFTPWIEGVPDLIPCDGQANWRLDYSCAVCSERHQILLCGACKLVHESDFEAWLPEFDPNAQFAGLGG